jgi:hypothetical protein
MRRQQGIAVVLAMVFVVFLTVGFASLLPVATTERWLSAVAREAAECRYAAEAVVVHAITELQARPDWDGALSGTEPSAFADSVRTPRVAGIRPLDLDATGASHPTPEPGAWGADQPQWMLFGWGAARDLAPGLTNSSVYVAVWAADDERDGDGDPRRDSNGRLTLLGEAFGPIHGRRNVVVSVAREIPAPGALRLLDWRQP